MRIAKNFLRDILRAVPKGMGTTKRQEAKSMKKFFKENVALLVWSTGLFSASLVVGLIFFYGLDKIF